MQDSLMNFELRQAKPNCVVLRCRGVLSWEDRVALADGVEQHLDGQAGVLGVVLDLGEVTFINSAGLGALFQLAQRLRARQTRLAFANVSPMLKRLFQTVGLDHFARIGDDLNTILDSFSAPADQPQPQADARFWGQAPSVL